MRRRRSMGRRGTFILRLTIFFGVTILLCLSCNNNSLDGFIVAVELPEGNENSMDGAALIAVDPINPEKTARSLSEDFHSACQPVLSNNGRYLIFSGKKRLEDSWQIWRMDLQKKSTNRVTDLSEDCTHPAFLPDGKIVFSRSGLIKDVDISTLFKCNMDGSELQQLTFHPHMDLASSVLMDGRILYTSSQRYPREKNPVYMVMRPDGTKSEIFYRGNQGNSPVSSGTESEEGSVYFIERNYENQGGRLMMLNQNRPLNSSVVLSEGLKGEFRSVIPLGSSLCLVSYRSSSNLPFALHEFDTEEQKILQQVFASESDVVDPVIIQARKRPRILPSNVNPENPTGLLMSQDINHSLIPANGEVTNDTVADHIHIVGLEGVMSEVEVKEDGSFYLKIDADIPIRILSINEQGETIRGPSDWFWLRPNERRGCVGCHADPELAPDNIQPLAVRHPPTIVSAKQK
ncbi:MAG: hypothetical protein ABFS38_17015 [Bacteroidota bacterium]